MVNIPSRLRCARCGTEWTWGGDVLRASRAGEIPLDMASLESESHVHQLPDLFANTPMATPEFQDSMDIPERPPGPELTAPGPVPPADESLSVPHPVTREEAFRRIIEHTRERATLPRPKKRRRGRVIALIIVIVLIVLFFILRGLFTHAGAPAPG